MCITEKMSLLSFIKNTSKTTLATVIGAIAVAIGSTLYAWFANKDVTGQWTVFAKTEKTNYKAFKNAIAVFKVQITQGSNDNLKGSGEKIEEIDADGKIIKYEAVQRDRISFEGKITQHLFKNPEIFLDINEQGLKYNTTAHFSLHLINNDSLSGSFYTTISDGSGSLTMHKDKE